MTRIMYSLFICIGLAAGLYGGRSWGEWRNGMTRTEALEHRLKEIVVQEERLERFKISRPLSLDERYTNIVKDALDIARVYRLGVTIERASAGAGIILIDGVKQVRLKIVFSKVNRLTTLISLLAVLDSCADAEPFLAENITQRKDSLTLDVILFGG
ncbi:MAG: hypothetical protein HQL22_06525 [Candidatus Omnitrophica bacterium]|nr:hypothetical protein [Candidatus Omnitrophota bacterium]